MKHIGSCSLDCIKQLLPNLAASGLWDAFPWLRGGATAAAATVTASVGTVPLAVGLACVAAYIGLTRICARKSDAQEQAELRKALEILRRRSRTAERELADIGFHQKMHIEDISRRLIGLDTALEGLKAHFEKGFADLDTALEAYFQQNADRFDDMTFLL